MTDDPRIVVKAAEQTGLDEVAMPQENANVIASLAFGMGIPYTGG